jgi:hypothetical protein
VLQRAVEVVEELAQPSEHDVEQDVPGVLATVLAEQVGRVLVEVEQEVHGVMNDVQHDPFGVVARQLARPSLILCRGEVQLRAKGCAALLLPRYRVGVLGVVLPAAR